MGNEMSWCHVNSIASRMAKIVSVKLPEPIISSGEEEEYEGQEEEEEEEPDEDNFPPAWQG